MDMSLMYTAAADMVSAMRSSSSVSNTWAAISVCGAIKNCNPHVQEIYFWHGYTISIACPSESVFAAVSNCVEQVKESRELGFLRGNFEDATKMVLFILRQDPSVVDAVRQYLADNGKYVTPKEIDLVFVRGSGKTCKNRSSQAKDLITESPSGMFEGETALAVATKWHAQARQVGARILVETPRGCVEEDKANAIKRLTAYLKHMQCRMTNGLVHNEKRNARRLEVRIADIERRAMQLQALREAALVVDINLPEFILSCHHPGIKDADILLNKLRPVFHLTPKNTSDPKEWFHTSDDEPLLASNATLQAERPDAHDGYHKPRNSKDTANWGSPCIDSALDHLTTHHGYRNRTEFDLLMFTSANKLYPGWHQFKVYSKKNQIGSVWPDCARYTMCYVDPVPCLIVKLKLAAGGVVDRNTKMIVTWMNGKRVAIDANDKRFEITSSGAITHPEA